MRKRIRLLSGVLALVMMFTLTSVSATAGQTLYEEVQLSFQSSDQTTLNGSLLIPPVPGPHPAVIFIHGAGWHDREALRAEAELFAAAGIAAFIYDKRTARYSPDGIGEDSRSYALLADDVHAAVNALRLREDLDPRRIGLWGLSEGASVAALIASQNSDVSFVITVGASGVMPAQQTSWAMEHHYRYLGITSTSFLHTMTRTGMRFLVSMGLFAEALYDHVPPLEKMQQPILALWGSKDRITPPAENYALMRTALERGGNDHVTFQFIPDASHDLRESPDGFIESEFHASG